MKPKHNKKNIVENPTGNRQIHMVVDGFKVKLNFPPKSENTAVSDIKRMMLGNVIKT